MLNKKRRQAEKCNGNTADTDVKSHGVPKSYAWNKCGRVYPLQGLLFCAHCGAPMSPHYVHHKAGGNRRKDSYIHHYVCTEYRKYGRNCDHANRILAKNAVQWMLDRVKDLVESEAMVERALGFALQNSGKDLAPAQEELSRVRAGLQETQKQIDSIVETMMSGTANEAMASLLNERASALKLQRDGLRAEQRRLTLELTPLEERFDANVFRQTLCSFDELVAEAQPQEIQRMLRLLLRKVEWGSDGTHNLHFYSLSQSQPVKTKKSAFQNDSENADWFDITLSYGCPGRWSLEPIYRRVGQLMWFWRSFTMVIEPLAHASLHCEQILYRFV